jgi:hypothetical protein
MNERRGGVVASTLRYHAWGRGFKSRRKLVIELRFDQIKASRAAHDLHVYKP